MRNFLTYPLARILSSWEDFCDDVDNVIRNKNKFVRDFGAYMNPVKVKQLPEYTDKLNYFICSVLDDGRAMPEVAEQSIQEEQQSSDNRLSSILKNSHSLGF